MALPNIKSKIFEYSTPKHKSQGSQSRRFDYSFSLQKSVETLEHLDNLKPPRHKKSQSLSLSLSKELEKLEQDLDYSEMRNQRSSPSEQYQVYRFFLDSLSQVLKTKDEKLFRLLNRGLLGYERIFLKLSDSVKVEVRTIEKLVKPKVETSDQEIQTEVTKAKPESLDADYENLKSLPVTLNKIKLSRISNRLEELYDNLTQMQTEIPSPTSSPELEPVENVDPKRFMNLQFTVMRENITKILKNPEIAAKRLTLDKSVQVAIEAKGSLLNILEKMNNEKELDIFKLRSQNSVSLNEKNKLEEALVRGNNLNSILEDKLNENESEMIKIKKENLNLVARNKELAEKVKKLQDGLEELMKNFKNTKKEAKNLKNWLIKKQKMLQDSLDRLYNSEVMLKVAEKKLKNIEKGFLEKTGQQFKFRDINIIEVANKAGIKRTKLQSIDVEINEIDLDEDEDDESEVVINIIDVEGHRFDETKNKSRKVSRNSSVFDKQSENSESSLNSDLSFTERNKSKDFTEKKQVFSKSPRNQVANRRTIQRTEDKLPRNDEKLQKHEEKDAKEKTALKKNEIHSSEITKPEKEAISTKTEDNENVLKDEKAFLEREGFLRNNLKKEPVQPQEVPKVPKTESFPQHPIKKSSNPEKTSEPIKNQKSSKPEVLQKKVQSSSISPKIQSSKPGGQFESSSQTTSVVLKPSTTSVVLKPSTTTDVGTDSASGGVLVGMGETLTSLSIPPMQKIPGVPSFASLTSGPSLPTTDRSARPVSLTQEIKTGKSSRKPETLAVQCRVSEDSSSIPTPSFVTPEDWTLKPSQKLPNQTKASKVLKSESKKTEKVVFEKSDKMTGSDPASKTFGEVSAYVPSKVPAKEEDSKAKSENSLFEQETLSRSFETEKINSLQILAESPWFASLSEEQVKSFSIFQEKITEMKSFLVMNCSKSVQCLLLDGSAVLDQKKFCRGKEKYKDLLGKVFEHEDEIDALPSFLKMRILREMKGHRQECEEVCEHLKRVMRIKKKIRGVPYPLKVVRM